MILKGINPFIVNNSGQTAYDLATRAFKEIDKKLLGRMFFGKTAAFYSFINSNCGKKCKENCDNRMRRFKLYTGTKKFENEKRGGEGIVGFGKWHGEDAAFKKVELGKIENVDWTSEAISNAEKTRAEFEVAKKLSHENIVKVLHLFRYQETDIAWNNRVTKNWTLTVMEKHSKNIGELTETERPAIKNLLKDSLGRSFKNLIPLFKFTFIFFFHFLIDRFELVSRVWHPDWRPYQTKICHRRQCCGT